MELTSESEAKQAPETDQVEALLKRAEAGDRSVLPELRKALNMNPNIASLYGDLALQAEGALITLAAGENLLMAECLQRKLAETKTQLLGGSTSPLEKLLVERIVLT